MVCGIVWGAGVGFGIVAAGTVLGEIAVFLYVVLYNALSFKLTFDSVFRLACGKRSDQFEKESLQWGVLAHIVRDGGVTMVLMARLSLLPPHCTCSCLRTRWLHS